MHEWVQLKGQADKCGLSEACYHEGVLAGATLVDDAFEKLLRDKVGGQVYCA